MSEYEIVDAKEGAELTDENTIRCLDKGFVRLVDVMGDDSSVVQAARVSYGKGTKSVREDKRLINYLMKHRHTSPFEMVEFKFHCKMPIFVARQWIRHRTASVNELSGRYSVMKDEVWEPSPSDLRKQSQLNKQCSTQETVGEPHASKIIQEFKEDQRRLFEHYNSYLESGIAREIARANLPLSTYTEWYWKIDLHNLFHFLELRLAPEAQREIRVYAEAISEFVKRKCPLSWEAFEEHSLKGVRFSRSEIAILRSVIKENWLMDKIEEMRLNQLKKEGLSDSSIRVELTELREKLTGERLNY
jgi:thymidylate synthase (FAD)